MTAITVCVPVYNGAEFVGDTLERIAAQTFTDFRVKISIDRGEDASAEVCQKFTRDPRFEVLVQPERLGWIGNVNALIGLVETEFFCITPHDDLLHPQYLEKVHSLVASDASIACAYTDIVGFGSKAIHIVQPDIRGGLLERALEMLLHHEAAVAFRGLVRRTGNDDKPLLPEMPRSFAADCAWLMTLALRGELRRIPESLYEKRYMATSVHAGWPTWPRDELVELRATLAATCAKLAHAALDDEESRELVTAAAMMRVMGVGRAGGPGLPEDNAEETAALAVFHKLLGGGKPVEIDSLINRNAARQLREALEQHSASNRQPSLARRIIRRLLRAS